MKKLLLTVLAALALVVGVGVDSDLQAQGSSQWRSKPVSWRLSRFASGTSTVTAVLDTCCAHVGGTNAVAADTTGWFVLDNLSLPINWNSTRGGAGTIDTTLVAVVTVYQDTTVDAAPNLTEIPYLVQIGREYNTTAGVAPTAQLASLDRKSVV